METGTKSFLVLFICLILPGTLIAQPRSVQVMDSLHRQPVPFALLSFPETGKGEMADLQGRLSISAKAGDRLVFSALGFMPRSFSGETLPDTVWLIPRPRSMEELVVAPPYEKIRRLIETAISQKSRNNPENYPAYQCHIYYKMVLQAALPEDSATRATLPSLDSFLADHDLLVAESYTHRAYQKPGRVQETVLASRLSGFKESPFAPLITQTLPFHAYNDYIELNQKKYGNPLAKGWERRYVFTLAEEWIQGEDTFFVLPFWPKKAYQSQGLRGQLVLCSDGYAISHLEASTADTSLGLTLSFEQAYAPIEGKWFPQALQYRLSLKPRQATQWLVQLSGYSQVDSVGFSLPASFSFRRAYPVQQHRKADQRTEAEWETYRPEPLSPREERSLAILDSLSEEQDWESMLRALGKVSTEGKLPLGPLDVDLGRIWTYNRQENLRLGLGLSTNEKLSPYLSLGGWAGYGFRDRVWKYGADLRLRPWAHPDQEIHLYYSRDYVNKGQRLLPSELRSRWASTLLFFLVDEVETLGAEARWRWGYFDLGIGGVLETLRPGPPLRFQGPVEKDLPWERREARLNLRYAFGEKRIPVFGTYLAQKTEFPIAYVSLAAGTLKAGPYSVPYVRGMAALQWEKRFPRWGRDSWILELGGLRTEDNRALPLSFLPAIHGLRMGPPAQVYFWGGLMTVYPHASHSDRYLRLGYRHIMEMPLYHRPWSSPHLGFSHLFWLGQLHESHRMANEISGPAVRSFHESGILVHRLLRIRYLNLFYVQLQAGLLFPWTGGRLLQEPPRLAFTLEIE